MIACFMSSRMIFPMSFRGIRSSSISRSVDAKSDGLDIPFDPGPESSQTRHFTQLKHRMPQARKQLASVAGRPRIARVVVHVGAVKCLGRDELRGIGLPA